MLPVVYGDTNKVKNTKRLLWLLEMLLMMHQWNSSIWINSISTVMVG